MNDDKRHTAAEAAEWLRVSVHQVYRLCKSGELGHYLIGSKYVIPESALVAYDEQTWVAPRVPVTSIGERRHRLPQAV